MVSTFSSPETTILLISTENHDLWSGPTPEVCDSLTSCYSAHALSQVWQIWLVLVSIYCVYKAIQNRNVVGPGERSWFSVLTKRIAASGDENVVSAATERSHTRSLVDRKLQSYLAISTPRFCCLQRVNLTSGILNLTPSYLISNSSDYYVCLSLTFALQLVILSWSTWKTYLFTLVNVMGDSFVPIDVSMEIHHVKIILGNGGHTRFASFPR